MAALIETGNKVKFPIRGAMMIGTVASVNNSDFVFQGNTVEASDNSRELVIDLPSPDSQAVISESEVSLIDDNEFNSRLTDIVSSIVETNSLELTVSNKQYTEEEDETKGDKMNEQEARITELEAQVADLTSQLEARNKEMEDKEEEANKTEASLQAKVEALESEARANERFARLQELNAVAHVSEDADKARETLASMSDESYAFIVKFAESNQKTTDQSMSNLPNSTDETHSNQTNTTDATEKMDDEDEAAKNMEDTETEKDADADLASAATSVPEENASTAALSELMEGIIGSNK